MEIERRDPGPSWTETVVKAGLSAVPFIGGPLSTLVDDMSARHRARVTEFAQVAIALVGDPYALVAALQQEERVADLFFQGAIAASATSDERKRHAMGLVVGQAADGDDARIEESQLLLDALRDLDAPHFAVLSRVLEAADGQDAVRKAADAAPDPVVAALIRHGLVKTLVTWGGDVVVVAISEFGEKLLSFVRE